MDAVALDSSVLIAYFDPRDAHHRTATERLGALLHSRTRIVVSAVTYAEILVHPIRAGREEVVEQFLARTGIEVVDVTRSISAAAARWRALQGGKLPDAFPCATARALDADLVSFDDQQIKRWESV